MDDEGYNIGGHENPYSIVWQMNINSQPDFTSFTRDGNVLVICKDGEKATIIGSDGDILQEFNLPTKTREAIESKNGDGMYFIGDNIIYKCNLNGNLMWQKTLGHKINDCAISPNRENVIIATEDKYLYFIGTEGELIQRHRSPEPFTWVSTPVVGDVVSSSSDVSLFLLTEDGEIRWTYKLKWPVSFLEISPHSKYIVVSALSELYCFDLQQRIKWRRQMPSIPVEIELSGNDRLVFVMTKANEIIAMALEDGRVIWRQKFKNKIRNIVCGMDSTYLVVIEEDKENNILRVLDFTGREIWHIAEKGISNASISMDGTYVGVGYSNGDIKFIENLHKYIYMARSLTKRLEELAQIGINVENLRSEAFEAIEMLKRGQYTVASTKVRSLEKALHEKVRDAVLTVVPRIQSDINELKSVNNISFIDTIPEWNKLKKVFDLAIVKMEKKDYYSALKLANRAGTYISMVKDKLKVFMEQRQIEEMRRRVDEIKKKSSHLPDNLVPVDIGAELGSIDNLIKTSRFEEAISRIDILEQQINNTYKEYMERRAQDQLTTIEDKINKAMEGGIEVFDAKSLLTHAKNAFNEGDYSLTIEYCDEINRILETRMKGSTPQLKALRKRFDVLAEHVQRCEEDEGIMLDGIKKLLFDAGEYLDANNIEKAEILLKRAESDFDRTLAAVKELRAHIDGMEHTVNRFADEIEMGYDLVAKIEEAKFVLAEGDISRAKMLIKRIEREIEAVNKSYRSENGGSSEKNAGAGGTEVRESGQGPNIKICPECGAKIPSDFQFCGKCGKKLPQ